MDILKWLLKASLILAFMFLGLKAQPNKEDPDEKKPQKTISLSIFN